MHITLQPIQDLNIFIKNPELLNIWTEPFNSFMSTSYLKTISNLQKNNSIDYGNIFAIIKNDLIVGVTGYFFVDKQNQQYNENPHKGHNLQTVHLRWHGIIDSERRQGISEVALKLLLLEVQKKHHNILYLIELVPQNHYGKNVISKHFQALGFSPFGSQEKYDWFEDGLCQPYRLDIRDFLLNHK